MQQLHEGKRELDSIPVGKLGVISLEGCRALAERVDKYLVEWRTEREHEHKNSLAFEGYQRSSYLISSTISRFGTGEAKGTINESIRGMDLYLMADICNYNQTYTVCGRVNHMSPDDHFQDLKRIIAAVGGHARRITVIMPFLYEGRQNKRSGRESLDCAIALQELVHMGVSSIITFDAHDTKVQNAIPLHGFETIRTQYQFIKGLLYARNDLKIDSAHMMIVSPDEAGMNRAIYLANVLGLDMGMFYKRRDYTRLVNGQNPVVAHEFLGTSVEGKDILVIDDMISSGDSALDVARELKNRNAGRIFIMATFGLFTQGLEEFDKAYEQGVFSALLTTNCVYQPPELLSREYYISCDMSKYIAFLIDTLNHDSSISDLLTPNMRIQSLVSKYQAMDGDIARYGNARISH